jgi:hypothetical protein
MYVRCPSLLRSVGGQPSRGMCDKRLDPAQPMGDKTSAWIGKVIGKASKGMLKVSQHLGLPQ